MPSRCQSASDRPVASSTSSARASRIRSPGLSRAAIVTAAVFAVRLRPDAEPTLSSEHDSANWHDLDEAHQQVIWPGYRTAIERIRDDLSEPERAAWFELTIAGDRSGVGESPKLTRW